MPNHNFSLKFILPSKTSLALELGRAVHMILINATRRPEIVTISEIQKREQLIIILTNIIVQLT